MKSEHFRPRTSDFRLRTSDFKVYHPRVRLILASASPRRAELLRAAGYDFETVVVDIDERVRPGEAPEDYVRRLAMEKSARAVDHVGLAVSRSSITLAADTGVVVNGTVLGKPLQDDEVR